MPSGGTFDSASKVFSKTLLQPPPTSPPLPPVVQGVGIAAEIAVVTRHDVQGLDQVQMIFAHLSGLNPIPFRQLAQWYLPEIQLRMVRSTRPPTGPVGWYPAGGDPSRSGTPSTSGSSTNDTSSGRSCCVMTRLTDAPPSSWRFQTDARNAPQLSDHSRCARNRPVIQEVGRPSTGRINARARFRW